MNNNIVKITGAIVVVLILVKVLNISYPIDLQVTNRNVSSEMAVTGEGKVDIVPDTGYIDGGITVSGARTADEAKEKMTKINNAIIDGVKSLGIKKEDITTTNYSVNPDYNYSGGVMPLEMKAVAPSSAGGSAIPQPVDTTQGAGSKITGYTGSANITVKVRNKDLVTQVIQKMSAAGANNIGSPRFAVDDPAVYREMARNKAIKNAREQATKLSKSLGIHLGRITNMVEGGGNYPMAYDRMGVASMKAEAVSTPPTIEEGSQSVTSSVTLYYETK